MEDILEELKRYVGFDANDEASLCGLHPILSGHFERIAGVFYQRILEHPDARKALEGGESQVGRLKVTLQAWMDTLATAGRPTAGLSHEIRNPLNAAGLQLAVLERRIRKLGPADQPSLLEPVRLVQDEIKRLDHILEDFLRLAGPVDVSPVPIDANEVIRKVLGLMKESAERRGVEIQAELGEIPLVRADPGRFHQFLLNLALNAVDAAAPKGLVRISSWLEARQVCVAVDDGGPGIAPELRDRIFEPLFTTKPSGSGLGLSIVHSIIRQHGGSIEVGEGPLGGGARFLVRLPVG